jgi:hypothetical protein
MPKVGQYVFLRREQVTAKDQARHKLSPRALGPFRVTRVQDDSRTVEIDREGVRETVNVNRVEISPKPSDLVDVRDDAPSTTRVPAVDAGNRVEDEYVVEKILNHRQAEEKPEGCWEYHVKWYGHDVTTWEPISNLRRNQVASYAKRRKMPLPPDIEETFAS